MSNEKNYDSSLLHVEVCPQRPSGTHKRIIVFCDGTWQDGLDARQKWKHTNVLRLARSINHVDERFDPPVHQVVFYQNGIGTDNLFDKIVDGVPVIPAVQPCVYSLTRHSASKVEEAYGFVAHNYRAGDEIFLFGYSRGAYTAPMVAMFIGAIGVLDRMQMDHFASIFLDYQKRGKTKDEQAAEKRLLDEKLRPWTNSNAPGKLCVNVEPGHFSIEVVRVFDTVGSIGMPEELTLTTEQINNIFGFPDCCLGHHVKRAYQALALDETRADFTCAKFEQTKADRERGQALKQCWFPGSHCDIGGGLEEHDLSDLTLNWLIANVEDVLSFNDDYVTSLSAQPDGPWGTQPPHNPLTRIYKIAKVSRREPPRETNEVTHETIHPSVMEQQHISPDLRSILSSNSSLLHQLLPWELKAKDIWDARLHPESFRPHKLAGVSGSPHHHRGSSLIHKTVDKIKHLQGHDGDEAANHESHSRRVGSWLQSSIGPVVQELLK